MNYSRTTVNFRDVVAGDSFTQQLTIADVFPLTEDTVINMQIRPQGDFNPLPVLSFSTGEGISISGQTITLEKSAEEMTIPPGRYFYQCQFTTGDKVTTLFGGIFEIVRDKTLI